MYARVVSARISPERLGALTARIASRSLPVNQEQDGFREMTLLTDPETGQAILMVFFETEAHARATDADGALVRTAFYGDLDLQDVEVNHFHVALHHQQGAPEETIP